MTKKASGTERPLAKTPPWTLSADAVLQALHVDPLQGLSQPNVAPRQAKYGLNRLEAEEGPSWGKILIGQIFNAMLIVLVAGMCVSLAIQSWIEGGVVAFVVLLNITVGFIQEYSAEQTMASLRSMASPTARVIRDSSTEVIPSVQLVPGDIVVLATGDIVPADLRLIEAMNLEADEALLTGEAVPVPKAAEAVFSANDEKLAEIGVGDRINMAYSSSCVTRGRGKGVVVGTGMHTEIGAIAQSLASTNPRIRRPKPDEDGRISNRARAKAGALTFTDALGNFLGVNKGSPLQRKLSQLAIFLFFIAVICAIIVEAAHGFSGQREVVLYAVGTGLCIIPASLVAVLTVIMAVGAKSMVKEHVIVRKLDSLEALGAVTDVCSDKTGTLTQGKMVTRMAWIPAEGTYQVADTNEPYNPTIGNLTFHPQPAAEVVAAISTDDDDFGMPFTPGEALPPRPELKTEPVNDPKAHGGSSSSISSFINCAALCNLANVFESREQIPIEGSDGGTRQGELTGKYAAVGDPTEIAIQVFAHRFGRGKSSLMSGEKRWKEVYEYPFDSDLKRMAVIMESASGKQQVFVKGAVEMVLRSCTNILAPSAGHSEHQGEPATVSLDAEWRAKILTNMEAIASRGLRCLALATKHWDKNELQESDLIETKSGNTGDADGPDDQPPRRAVERDLTFLGLIGIYDPPRPESAPSVAQFAKASIRVHMLTGDHPGTALAIAKEVGIVPHHYKRLGGDQLDSVVMTAAQFDGLTDDEIDALAELPLVIARCAPQTKVRMIEALHRRGCFAAMTGDGVNDSPSLKKADIGIAMGQTGSDVAKSASEIVLTDDNFASILSAVASGRRTFDNIKKFVLHLLAQNVGQAIVLLVGLVFKDSAGLSVFPLSPVEILWVIMVTSSFPAIGLGFSKAAPDLMSRPPHNIEVGIFTWEIVIDMMVYGVIMGALCFGAFTLVLFGFGDGQLGDGVCNERLDEVCREVFRARATCFCIMCCLSLLLAWQAMSLRRSFFRMHPKSPRPYTQWMIDAYDNRILFISVVAGIALLFPLIYIPVINDVVFKHAPITWEWAIVFIAAGLFMALAEGWKLLKRVYFRRQDVKLGIRRSYTVDDQRYIVPGSQV